MQTAMVSNGWRAWTARYMRRRRSTCRTSRSSVRSASATVKKKTPPSIFSRRYHDMIADYRNADAWARRCAVLLDRLLSLASRLCPPYKFGQPLQHQILLLLVPEQSGAVAAADRLELVRDM